MNTRHFFPALILVFLFACSGGEPDEVVFRNTDNIVRVGVISEPTSLLPILSSDPYSRYVTELIYQTINGQDPQTLEAVPQLAGLPDIVQEPNGKVSYAYRIDPEATWPDGSPVTAADVVFSMKLFLSPLIANGSHRVYFEFVENISTSPNDERRFKVLTDGPYLLTEHVLGELLVLPEYVYDPEKSLRTISMSELASARGAAKLAEESEVLRTFSTAFNELIASRDPADFIGSGPYAPKRWEEGQRIELERRPDYWAAGSDVPLLANAPDGVIYEFIEDATTLGTALRDELVDVVSDLPTDQFLQMSEEEYLTERYDFITMPTQSYFGLVFNQNEPLFRDVATRRAFTRLVDVDRIIDRLFPGGMAERINGPVLRNKPYYNDELPLIDYDPATARAELAAAGWEDTNGNGILDREIDGVRTEFDFDGVFFSGTTGEAIGTLIREWAAEVGIRMNLVTKAGSAVFEQMDQGDFDLSIIGQGFTLADDDFTQVWASSSVPPDGDNRSGFASQEADALIRKIKVTLDPKDRYPLYREFQKLVYDNQPMVFLFSPKSRLVISKRLEYTPVARSPHVLFNALQLRK